MPSDLTSASASHALRHHMRARRQPCHMHQVCTALPAPSAMASSCGQASAARARGWRRAYGRHDGVTGGWVLEQNGGTTAERCTHSYLDVSCGQASALPAICTALPVPSALARAHAGKGVGPTSAHARGCVRRAGRSLAVAAGSRAEVWINCRRARCIDCPCNCG